MPRPRKKGNEKLPPYVYLNNGRYEYRPHLGKGILARPVRLCSGRATITEVWRAYDNVKDGAAIKNLDWLFRAYTGSERFLDLAPRTQKAYRSYQNQVGDQMLKSGKRFGEVGVEAITKPVIRKLMDRVKEERGAVTANRQYAFMQAAFKWGAEYGKVRDNPCVGIKKFPEKARTRYVTDAEYDVCYSVAPASLRILMELAYLCRLRVVEALSLEESDCLREGIRVDRVKGSKKQIIGWSPRLREAVKLSGMLRRSVGCTNLIRNRLGQPYTVDGIETNWQKVIRPVFEEGKLIERYTLHDLKAKGVSDFDGDKFKASGHKARHGCGV